MFSLRYCKNIVIWFFLLPWACLATHTQSDTIIFQKGFVYTAGKEWTSSPMLLWRYCKGMKTYFGCFGHAWLHSPKMIESPCRRLQCLSACKKQTSSFTFFSGYYILKNPAIWLAGLVFILNNFQGKLAWQNFSKNPKTPILGPFWDFVPKFGKKWIVLEKWALSVFQYSNYLPLCQKLGKPNEPFLRKLMDGHTKHQFIPLISLWDAAKFRVLWLIEKSCNLIG